ncbi:MAG TPA: riboflavin synthase [Candidatus Kapabacteria bacterium]|nr:riboflavin synthase [Candidatus Kapabacteria bacterium]
MFTGIIEELGTVIAVSNEETSLRIEFRAGKVLEDLKVDDSIAVNGVCQTVVKCGALSFEVICVSETIAKTTLSSLKVGNSVNLERSATLSTRLGGHLVYGHVDGVARIERIVDLGGSWEFYLKLPPQFMKYVILRGSIAIEGVSLTVAERTTDTIKIAVIPHTFEQTTFSTLREGMIVNVELDCIAKMVEQMLAK